VKTSLGIETLKGVGEKTKLLFEKAGIHTLGDLLDYYPHGYESYAPPKKIADLREGETAAVCAMLTAPLSGRYVRGLRISSATCRDESGELMLSWYNMPYLKNTLRTGVPYIFRGRLRRKGQWLLLEQPAVFHEEQYRGLGKEMHPQYSLVKGLTNTMISKAVAQVLHDRELTEEYLPLPIRSRYQLCEYNFAIEQIHFPKDSHALSIARRRLVFDEFFFFLMQLRSLKQISEKQSSGYTMHRTRGPQRVIASLPYQLTGDQMRVWETLQQELTGDKVMARLIQGDVGSGKTIVSVLALILVAENGLQGALMAPTEVLARQHYQFVCQLLEKNDFPFQAVLLTGSMTAKEKREAYAKIKNREALIVIGTHALIQEKVEYQDLALVITDEQHRFGVRQRESLAQKGRMPHTIVMSATPIPRTLAVILYGDLDISVIKEMPANRLPIKNCVVDISYRQTAYRFIADQVAKGHQAYVICPMVEESEAIEAENVIEYSAALQEQLPPSVCVEYLHGKMKPKEKNEIMERFLANEIQVLVSTTVIEVGVNVPNATVMMVENSERFGLAQLHQLRGRVGRGDAQSYCIFVHTMDGKDIRERLDILNHSNDGFEIANRDMKLRGPGDLFGVRQSGMMDFALADIYTDAAILQLANEAVNDLLHEDPALTQEEHQALRRKFERLQSKQADTISL
jgi:ATP-dependent DNA helicase RecG